MSNSDMCKGGRRREHKSAFTFIEVMVALAVASVWLLAILKLHLTSMRTAGTIEKRTEAVLLAEQVMAEKFSANGPLRSSDCGTAERDGTVFYWRSRTEDARLPLGKKACLSGLKKLVVTVDWGRGRAEKTFELTSYVARQKTE